MLVADGFSPARALAIYRAVVSYARGYALAEATGFTVVGQRTAVPERVAALTGHPQQPPASIWRGARVISKQLDRHRERYEAFPAKRLRLELAV